LLARHNVINIAYWKSFDIDTAFPRVVKLLDAVRCKDQAHVEGVIFELNEIFSPADFRGLVYSPLC
jgi:uncharacterized protein Usg